MPKSGLGRGWLLLPFLAALVGLLAVAPAAQATFHLIKVREVFPGTTARPNSGYVELQMYAAGQNLVQEGNLKVFNSAGTVVDTFTPSNSVTAAANQSTVLIADSEYAAQFPSGPVPDFTDSGLNLSPAGGAVCWPQTEPPFDDCASWGNFSGQGQLASPDAAPALPGGIPAGMAIRRSIAGGACPTLLEEADDTNNSSVDFAVVAPSPRANATTPTESTCAAPVIDTKPANPTSSTSASFAYHSSAGASFECRLDLEPFAACEASGASYSGLGEGNHTFQVRTASGTSSYTWRVDTTAPSVVVDNHPADPSSGSSAAFEFHASETAAFQCSLVLSGAPDSYAACTSGKTYSALANGEWVFKVKATDQALNAGAATSFAWEVDNSLADDTPPQTTLTSTPPDPSPSGDVAFAYRSNEPGSRFECTFDGAAFSACPASGIAYTGLANGPHSFQVRAIDGSGNADPEPAGYSFSVTAPVTGGGAVGNPPAGGGAAAPAPRPSNPTVAAPQTTLTGKPGAKTHDRTPSFRFRAGAPGVSFECALDKQPFKPCRSPYTSKPLKPGPHSFAVRARSGGATDASPAKFGFKVVGKG